MRVCEICGQYSAGLKLCVKCFLERCENKLTKDMVVGGRFYREKLLKENK